jgi:YYY domain-containing protein
MVKKGKKQSAKNSKLGLWFLFGLVMLAALVLRLYQPDWYSDRQFHPDERWITGSAVPGLSYPGKPIGMQYGSLPLYILSFYKDLLNNLRNNGWMKNLDTNRELIKGARIISGLFDSGTVVFIFFTALLLFGPKAALFSSALLAFTPLHIHSAHFATVDTFTAFFIAGLVYFAARIYKYGTLAGYILAGVFYGASLASKVSAAPAALVIIAAHLLNYFSIKGTARSAKENRLQSWINLGWSAAISFGAFFVFMPHAILDFNKFMSDTNEQRRLLVTGEADVPYTRQYWNTTPYLYYLKNLVLYTMGIPFGLVSLFAFFFYALKASATAIKGKIEEKGILMILAWMLPYFLIVGASFGKFNRYMLLLTPFLALLAGKFVYDFEEWVKEKKWALALKIFVLSGAVFYGLAFMNVYTNSHTWIQSSKWIYQNVPETTVVPAAEPAKNKAAPVQTRRTAILNEMWGDDLPVYADGRGSWGYNITKWNVQEPDTQNKINELSMRLNEADYVAMADRRAYGTYLRLPKSYPINYFYFKTMFTEPEKLGFKKVYEKAVYPSLFGLDIKDENADESFQLYDHPHVYIFKNDKNLSVDVLQGIIINGAQGVREKFGQQAGKGQPAFPSKVGTNNPNIGQIKDSLISLMPVLSVFIWYLLVQLLSFMAMPLHFKVLGNLRDKGYGLSKVTGIFIFAWINWMLVSFGMWKFYQVNLWILLAALGGLSFMAYRANAAQAMQFAVSNKKHILVTEIVFLAAYLFFIIIKLWCPDIHNVMGHGYNGGGEPMGMAYLSAIFNDVKFPPHDPWLAGFTLNYYYWGQLVLATLSKLLGFFPRVTYNLSLALLFALCFTSAFTLVYNLTGKYRYALFGGFLLALAGNFHTMVFMLDKLANAGNIQQFFMQLGSFQFIWDPTRTYPSSAITELPFFSYLYGDLHAHNIVIPFTVLVAAAVYNIIKAENKTMNIMNSLGAGLPAQLLTGFVLALGLGSMMVINTWNFPPVLLLVSAALFMTGLNLFKENFKMPKKLKPQELAKQAGLPALWILLAIAVTAAVSYVLFMPFHRNFQSPYGARLIPVSKPERASLELMFRFFSVFFFVIFTYMLFVWYKGLELVNKKTGLTKFKMRRFDIDKVMDHIVKTMKKILRNNQTSLRFITACAAAVIFMVLVIVEATFAFLFLAAVTCLWVLFTTRSREEIFAMLMLLISAGIIWGVEIVSIADGRMNTVFKFYMVAWTFLAIFVPYLLFRVVEALGKVFKEKKHDAYIIAGSAAVYIVIMAALRFVELRFGGGYSQAFFVVTMLMAPLMLFVLRDALGKFIFTGALVFLLVPAGLYAPLGAFFKMNICSMGFKQGPSIDGLKYMAGIGQRPGSIRDFDKFDYQAIEWINKNMKEIAPILEAPGQDMYSGLSRISIFTGMPTLVGWGYQVGQQSGRHTEVSNNNQIAAAIYRAEDLNYASDLMKKSGLRYYYIGNIEKSAFPGCDRLSAIGDKIYSNEVSALYKLRE